MPSDRALSPESRAAKMAGEDMSKVIETFKGGTPFMRQPSSSATAAMRGRIMGLPEAREALEAGLPVAVAERLAVIARREENEDPLSAIRAERADFD